MSRLAFPYRPAPSGRSDVEAYGSDPHCRQLLELLILTLVGERPMRPDLGSPVIQLLFGAGNGPTAIALQASLQATITQWLGHLIDLHDLSVAFDEAEAVLEIVVTYETLATRTPGRAVVRKDLA